MTCQNRCKGNSTPWVLSWLIKFISKIFFPYFYKLSRDRAFKKKKERKESKNIEIPLVLKALTFAGEEMDVIEEA